MYECFTDQARKVMQLASQEAQRFNHEYIGTEHILLGLIREESGVVASVLRNLDVDLREVRLEVEMFVQSGPNLLSFCKLPQTPRVKQVIQAAIEEAHSFNTCVGTEHLLLGLIEQEGLAGQALLNLGLTPEDVRQGVISLVGRSRAGREVPRCWFDSEPDLPLAVSALVQKFNADIRQLRRERDAAVALLHIDRAARLHNQAVLLKAKKAAALRDWGAQHPIDRSWLDWNGGAAEKLAWAIFEEGRWQELPILADALEDAGCTDAEILGHCRQSSEHVNGCWVLNRLLAKP
jgi:hypothetical protein